MIVQVSKRVNKEEKDILRIQSELNRLVVLARQRHELEHQQHSAGDGALGVTGVPSQAPFSLQNLLSDGSEIGSLIRKYTNELEVLKASFRRCQQEEKDVISQNALEQSKSNEIVEWMNSMKEILWPATNDVIALAKGSPLISGELPEGVRKAAYDAEKVGISKVEDVIYVVQCFLWMGWCFRCLDSLRGPITTNELRRLVNASRSIKFYDDRIVKVLINILTRSK